MREVSAHYHYLHLENKSWKRVGGGARSRRYGKNDSEKQLEQSALLSASLVLFSLCKEVSNSSFQLLFLGSNEVKDRKREG